MRVRVRVRVRVRGRVRVRVRVGVRVGVRVRADPLAAGSRRRLRCWRRRVGQRVAAAAEAARPRSLAGYHPRPPSEGQRRGEDPRRRARAVCGFGGRVRLRLRVRVRGRVRGRVRVRVPVVS